MYRRNFYLHNSQNLNFRVSYTSLLELRNHRYTSAFHLPWPLTDRPLPLRNHRSWGSDFHFILLFYINELPAIFMTGLWARRRDEQRLYTSEEVDVLEIGEDIKESVWLVHERWYSIVGNVMWIAGVCKLRTIESESHVTVAMGALQQYQVRVSRVCTMRKRVRMISCERQGKLDDG